MLLDLARLAGALFAVCGIGAAFVVVVRKALGLPRLRGRPTLVAVCFLVGLRTMTWLLHVTAAFHAPFKACAFVLMTLGAAYASSRLVSLQRWLKRSCRSAWRTNVAPTATVVGVVGTTAIAAFFAPPTAWDLFTHWLVVPYEIINTNDFLALNTATSSVVPRYALQHSALLASTLLLEVADGRLNLYAAVWVAGATIMLDSAMVFMRVRRAWRRAFDLAFLGLVFLDEMSFGYVYCDALVLFAICALLLCVVAPSSSGRNSAALGALAASLLVAKNYGYLIVCAAAVGIVAVSYGRYLLRRDALSRRDFGFAGGALLCVVLERLGLYAFTVKIGESNEFMRTGDLLSALLANPFAHIEKVLSAFCSLPQVILHAMASLLLVFAVRQAFTRHPTRSGIALLRCGVVCASVLGLLYASALADPQLLHSAMRYSLMLAPVCIAGVALRLAQTSTSASSLTAVTLFLALPALIAFGAWPTYVTTRIPKATAHLRWITGQDGEFLKLQPQLRRLMEASSEVADLSANYLLLNKEMDPFANYRVSLHLVRSSFRGHLYSDIPTTSRTGEDGEFAKAVRAAIARGDRSLLQALLADFHVVIFNDNPKPYVTGELVALTPAAFVDLVLGARHD